MSGLILGLDAQQLRLGWALARLEDGAPVRCGCISATRRQFSGWVRDSLRAIDTGPWVEDQGDIALVAIEDAHIGPSRMGSLRHAMAIGEVRQAVSRRWPDAAVQMLAPQGWKKLCGLPGNASKDLVMTKAIGLGWAPDGSQDAADAACVAYAVWRRNEWETR